MTYAQALLAAAAQGLTRLDAQLLMLHVTGRGSAERAWLLAHDADPMEPAQVRQYGQLCSRRNAGEPLAYLVGRKEFYGLDLSVDAAVLVPRPETETLVDWALHVLKGHSAPAILDLGTGSGAIALALQRARPDAHVEAVDSSEPALAVARANADRLGLAVQFCRGHWLQGCNRRFDLIISNPPYVAEGDPHLPSLSHEPRQALVAGPDGLDDLRQIIAQAPSYLQHRGWLLLEHGWDQAVPVRQLLIHAGLSNASSRQDLAGIQRCSGGQSLEHG